MARIMFLSLHSLKNMPLILLLISSFVFFFPHLTFAREFSRDEVIKEKLECIAGRQAQGLEWADVCYTSAPQTSSSISRKDIVNSALDAVAVTREKLSQRQDSLDDKMAAVDETSPREYSDLTPEPRQKTNARLAQDSSYAPPPKRLEGAIASGVPDLKKKRHYFEMGSEFFSYHYKEPELTVDVKGPMYGIYGLYEFRPDDKESAIINDVINMYKLDGRFSYGSVDYSSDPSGTSDNIDDYAWEIRGAAGYDFWVTPRNRITPYGGLGFRYLYDGGGGKETSLGDFGYDRVSHYLYGALGADSLNQIASGWQLGANLEGDILLWGRQDSYLSDVDAFTYPDLKNKQKRGFGLRGSVKLIKEAGTVNLLIEPFIRYWHIKNSDLTTAIGPGIAETGLEPNNNTTEFGAKLGIQY